MSLNFSANQFEEEYKPSKLRNWEIPKWFPKVPCQNYGKTHVISNERGHLLPGVPRSNFNPWGEFVGTWDLPKKISRQTAQKLSAPRKDRIQRWGAHCRKNDEIGVILRRSKKEMDISYIIETPTEETTDQIAEDIDEAHETEEIPKVFCPIHDDIYN